MMYVCLHKYIYLFYRKMLYFHWPPYRVYQAKKYLYGWSVIQMINMSFDGHIVPGTT